MLCKNNAQIIYYVAFLLDTAEGEKQDFTIEGLCDTHVEI
jgi:hypothetical protein